MKGKQPPYQGNQKEKRNMSLVVQKENSRYVALRCTQPAVLAAVLSKTTLAKRPE
jgi:hypothetical protein